MFKLKNITLYTSALCNLRCNYCYVAKNQYLQEVENAIIKDCSIKYYDIFLDKLSKYYDYSELRSISLWGGEPTIGLVRFTPIIIHLLKKFPSINLIMFSSNCTRKTYPDEFRFFCEELSKLGKKIIISAQTSIDGPPNINDNNRGIGNTSKIIENFNKITNICEEYLSKSKLNFTFCIKSTILFSQMEELAENPELLKSYYKFFYNNFKPKESPYIVDTPIVTPPIPCEYTQKDGLIFAKFLEECTKLQNSGEFKDENILQFGRLFKSRINEIDFTSYKEYHPFCGLATTDIGLLPDFNISLCHREFGLFVENYTNKSRNYTNGIVTHKIYNLEYPSPTIFPLKDADKYFPIFQQDWYHNSPVSLSTAYCNLIKSLAFIGQINSRYKDDKMALVGFKMLRHVFGGCVKDCRDITGSYATPYAGIIRLMLNGVDKILLEGTQYEY